MDLVEELENDLWGQAYAVTVEKLLDGRPEKLDLHMKRNPSLRR